MAPIWKKKPVGNHFLVVYISPLWRDVPALRFTSGTPVCNIKIFIHVLDFFLNLNYFHVLRPNRQLPRKKTRMNISSTTKNSTKCWYTSLFETPSFFCCSPRCWFRVTGGHICGCGQPSNLVKLYFISWIFYLLIH